jgi:hypothetical protein
MRNIEYLPGEAIGENGITYIKLAPYHFSKGRKNRRDEFLCFCGKTFITSISNIKSGHARSCGCLRTKLRKTPNPKFLNLTHGLSGNRFYIKWKSIKRRINNPNNPSYKNYGGRGIKLCDEWMNNPKAFIDYCNTLDGCEDESLTLDRRDNNGNYEHGNLRFVNRQIQALNQRLQKNNTSGKSGVKYNKTNNKWIAYIYIKGKRKYLYRGDYKEEAIAAREKFEKVYFKELGV